MNALKKTLSWIFRKESASNMKEVIRLKRERLFKNFTLVNKVGVEIGPLCYPLVERPEHQVYYVDHCNTDELRKKYRDHPNILPERIVDIDFVWGDFTLGSLLDSKPPMDYVVASHVVEHVPDLIGWLSEMRSVLAEDGCLALVVPDKRFTFDVYRRCCAFEEIRLAHEERRRKPGIRCVMDHFSNVVTADTWKMWQDYSVVKSFSFDNPPSLLGVAVDEIRAGKYVDVHCWVFTPWHFLEMLGEIIAATGLGFDLDHFQTTPAFDLEFYVRLKKVAGSSTTDWKYEAQSAKENALWPEPRGYAMEFSR
jgi:SAM-dependent methyltransferase